MASREEASGAPGGFLFNVNFVFLSMVASYGVAFLATVVLARALGPEGRGVTALYQAAVSLGFAFLSLGIVSAALYFVGRRDLSGRQAVEAGLSVTVAATAVSAAAILIAAALFADELAKEDVPYWLAVVAVPAVIQHRIVEAVLRAQARFGAMNLVELLMPVSLLAGLVAVEVVADLTIAWAVVVWSFSFLPAVVAGYVLMGREALPRRLAGLSLLSTTVRFGVQGQLSNLIQLLNYRLDTYLILLFVSKAGVGFYAVAVTLSEGMWFIANSVATVLQTNLTAGDEEYAARMTPVVCRNTLLVTAAGSLAAAAVCPVAIPTVYGDAFDDAVLPFLWLLPGTVALSGTKILASYVFSRGRPLINARIAFLTLAVTVAADLVLIPAFEVAGAAAGASLGYCLSLALTALAYRRLSGASIGEALLPRPADLALYVEGVRAAADRLPLTRRFAGSERRP